ILFALARGGGDSVRYTNPHLLTVADMATPTYWRWLKRLQATLRGGSAPRRQRGHHGGPRCKPCLEGLENRLAPATVQFALANESLLETAGTFTIPVTLSAAIATATSVPF